MFLEQSYWFEHGQGILKENKGQLLGQPMSQLIRHPRFSLPLYFKESHWPDLYQRNDENGSSIT